MLETYCIDVTGSAIPLIFFKKQTADIFRYLADHTEGDKRSKHSELARKNYEEAIYILDWYIRMLFDEKKDDVEIPYKFDSLRLGLKLNYAIFLFEIEKEDKQALRILRRELHEALNDFETWDEDDIEQIKMQVEIIQENINLWQDGVGSESEESNWNKHNFMSLIIILYHD